MRNRKISANVAPKESRTQRKQQALRLQRLGELLVDLPPDKVDRLTLPEELASAVAEVRQMNKHGARRRQLQYIGALMRALDPLPIENALADLSRGDRQQVRSFKQVEQWRDALLAGEAAVMTAIHARCPSVDGARLERLVDEARVAKAEPAKRKAARRLFRFLRDAAGEGGADTHAGTDRDPPAP